MDSDSVSREITNPPTLEIPGFPLDAPSKKITAAIELFHNIFNSSLDPWKRQGTILTVLKQTDDHIPRDFIPSHFENTGGKEEETIVEEVDELLASSD